jgi:hypothetical protein
MPHSAPSHVCASLRGSSPNTCLVCMPLGALSNRTLLIIRYLA